jgi:PhzF family phenazine biosynthesis protein
MKAFTAYAFPHQNQGGNPAGVVLDAGNLTAEQKQRIAGQLGLSETAFVAKDAAGDFVFEFFTPTRQIANCGHATVAAFGVMRELGQLDGSPAYRMRTLTGTNEVRFDGDRIVMQQRRPQYAKLPDEALFWSSLGLGKDPSGLPPRVVDTGNKMVVAILPSAAAMAALIPDFAVITAVSEACDAVGYYLYTHDVEGADVTTRMFGPRYGIREESATGMGAGALGAYLYDVEKYGKSTFVIEQGAFMTPPVPSRLYVEVVVRDSCADGVLVSGGVRIGREVEV